MCVLPWSTLLSSTYPFSLQKTLQQEYSSQGLGSLYALRVVDKVNEWLPGDHYVLIVFRSYWDTPQVAGKVCAYLLIRKPCLLYTSPSPRDGLLYRMPSSA